MIIGVTIGALFVGHLQGRRVVRTRFMTEVTFYLSMFADDPERRHVVIERRRAGLLPPFRGMA